MMMTQRTVGRFFQLLAFQELDVAHPRRRPQVIHDRVSFVESLGRNDVFVSDAFVLERWRRAVAVKPNVMFPRHLTELLIKRHFDLPFSYKLPRRSCSFSSASKSALKFPIPKLFAPLRWMISKKSVGRSSTGFENIWSR